MRMETPSSRSSLSTSKAFRSSLPGEETKTQYTPVIINQCHKGLPFSPTYFLEWFVSVVTHSMVIQSSTPACHSHLSPGTLCPECGPWPSAAGALCLFQMPLRT